jgi:hypothetical protein
VVVPPIHLLPILVAAVAAFALGAVWYSPLLFGKKWAAAHGHSPEKLEAMRARAGRAYAVSFLCYLLMAVAMSILIGRMDILYPIGGVKLGALLGIGFAATITLTAHVFSDKPLAAYWIDAGYQVAYLIVMGIVLVAWR